MNKSFFPRFVFFALLLLTTNGGLLASEQPPNQNLTRVQGGLHSHHHVNQHIGIRTFYNVPNESDYTNGNPNATAFQKMGNAFKKGHYKSLESIQPILAQILTQQMAVSLLGKILKSTDPSTQLNKCTNFLALAIKSKEMRKKSSYDYTIKRYCMEVEKLKNISPEGLGMLLEHAKTLEKMGENNLSLWQENNYEILVNGYKRTISLKTFLYNQEKQKRKEAIDLSNQEKNTDQSDLEENQEETSLKDAASA